MRNGFQSAFFIFPIEFVGKKHRIFQVAFIVLRMCPRAWVLARGGPTYLVIEHQLDNSGGSVPYAHGPRGLTPHSLASKKERRASLTASNRLMHTAWGLPVRTGPGGTGILSYFPHTHYACVTCGRTFSLPPPCGVGRVAPPGVGPGLEVRISDRQPDSSATGLKLEFASLRYSLVPPFFFSGWLERESGVIL
jgi:hypothetical protein